jgi:hypothetical protein
VCRYNPVAIVTTSMPTSSATATACT